MEKNLLVTISNEVENLFGVQFICSFFKEMSEHHLTLLHICRLDSPDSKQPITEMWLDPNVEPKKKLTPEAQRSLEKAKRLISTSNMSVNNILTRVVEERYGKVRDILTEGSKGLYDAIVLGRRASYTFQWVFERPGDETAQQLVQDKIFTSPVWICPEPEKGRQNVLLCVDGSKSCERIVDHTGYILEKQNQHNITLFHINNGTGIASEDIFTRATSILHSHNIPSNRINSRVTWGFSVPSTILNEIHSNNYAVVAMGLHGLKQNILKEYNLAGGSTSKIINSIEKASLWCCP